MILADTSAWIEYFRQTDSAIDRALTALIERGEDVALCGLVLTEVLQGIRHDRELRTVRGYLMGLPLYEPSSAFTYLRAAELYRDCRRRGLTLRGTVDCIIAATCLEHELSLLHNDADFDRLAAVSDLRIVAV